MRTPDPSAPPFTAAPGAKDLKSVMFNWGWYMGMLRSNEEYDVLMTLDYQGNSWKAVPKGTCETIKIEGDRTGSLEPLDRDRPAA